MVLWLYDGFLCLQTSEKQMNTIADVLIIYNNISYAKMINEGLSSPSVNSVQTVSGTKNAMGEWETFSVFVYFISVTVTEMKPQEK